IGTNNISYAVKAASTSRTTTTLSNDPDLRIAVTGLTSFIFEAVLFVSGTATGAMGIGFNVNYSGTFTGQFGSSQVPTPNNGFPINASATVSVASIATVASSSSGDFTMVTIKGLLTNVSNGTLSIAWA